MSEKKYVVPEAMVKAATDGYWAAVNSEQGTIRAMLEAAVRWLAENPVVPSDKQVEELWSHGHPMGIDERAWFVEQFQRIMFLAPEPAVPKAVKDLYDAAPPGGTAQKSILEAYNRGLKAGK